jgi:hypothetical protein
MRALVSVESLRGNDKARFLFWDFIGSNVT